ncbi:hypothetical protein STCU_10702 [Strigomonas culicis]|uniref:Uncharacterized protein n=1 Tax=Strigomonas culicis TaxID=28005 RepID=S9TLQ9_9TRYP|nr:hypothetical protein STCU_10702 [Strigomonas culicis]|eukprot:EPY17303.1 hypothetical protein STCU_10702 [Strigomonas culicis]
MADFLGHKLLKIKIYVNAPNNGNKEKIEQMLIDLEFFQNILSAVSEKTNERIHHIYNKLQEFKNNNINNNNNSEEAEECTLEDLLHLSFNK